MECLCSQQGSSQGGQKGHNPQRDFKTPQKVSSLGILTGHFNCNYTPFQCSILPKSPLDPLFHKSLRSCVIVEAYSLCSQADPPQFKFLATALVLKLTILRKNDLGFVR